MTRRWVYSKRGRLYARIKDRRDEWVGKATPYRDGDETLATRYARELQRVEDAKRAPADSSPQDGTLTVDAYANVFLAERRKLGLTDVVTDEGRLKNHVLPAIGHLRLDQVRKQHVRDLVLALRKADKLSPSSIRSTWGIMRTMFYTAAVEGRIVVSPCHEALKRGKHGDLPPKVDADPHWRATAVFTREELERLISDETILPDRRMVVALKGLAALRHGEAAVLRWRQVELDAEPLGRISLGSDTKTLVARLVPVHPTLAKMLAAWKLSGWHAVYGRAPKPDDLVVPTRALTERDASEAQVQFLEDLASLGMRHRRGHDLRRTFISLARADGADRDKLKAITHGPSRAILDLYTTWDFATLAAEVAKLNVRPRGVEKVARLATASLPVSEGASRRWAEVRARNEKAAIGPLGSNGVPDGIRTRVAAVKGPRPGPLDDRD